jgi:hypothetical protein
MRECGDKRLGRGKWADGIVSLLVERTRCTDNDVRQRRLISAHPPTRLVCEEMFGKEVGVEYLLLGPE